MALFPLPFSVPQVAPLQAVRVPGGESVAPEPEHVVVRPVLALEREPPLWVSPLVAQPAQQGQAHVANVLLVVLEALVLLVAAVIFLPEPAQFF
jgi:hypothetical protein